MKKQNNGITLIALIITVIVLLILAGVSIATLTGEHGILTQAEDAKTKTAKAELMEKIQLEMLVSIGNDGKYNVETAKENLKNNLGLTEENGNVVDNGDGTLTVTENGYEFFVDEYGVVTDPLDFGGIGLAKNLLTIDSTPATCPEGEIKSPYVKYNGLDCRVLYNDETHGLQLISAGSVEDVTLGYGDDYVAASDFEYEGTLALDDNFKKAMASYNNVVDNLNERAKSYMDAAGIAIDARCLGSVSMLSSDSMFQEDTSEIWSDSWSYVNHLTTFGLKGTFKSDYREYEEDCLQLIYLGLNVDSGNTWLAGRALTNGEWDAGFQGYILYPRGSSYYELLCGVDTDGSYTSLAPTNGFRPCFLISPKAIVSGGDGSQKFPYVLD